MTPKVFLSHASEDKDRFVLDFACKLRQNGVDVWLDKWEMLPGDSLVDKIFEEGLKEATAVIVVVSKFSIEKKWVKEELNAAVVKRISTGSKLIPIVLDNCAVPEALSSTLWEKILDPTAYDNSLHRVLAAIFGRSDKPALGSPPAYIQTVLNDIGGLTRTDNLVLKMSCEHAIESGERFLNPGKLLIQDGKPIVPESELADSLDILDRGGYIKLSKTFGAGFSHYQVRTFGLDCYARAYLPDYDALIQKVIVSIVNNKLEENKAIQAHLGAPLLLVDHILDMLESHGHLRLAKVIGGLARIYDVSPALRRSLSA